MELAAFWKSHDAWLSSASKFFMYMDFGLRVLGLGLWTHTHISYRLHEVYIYIHNYIYILRF